MEQPLSIFFMIFVCAIDTSYLNAHHPSSVVLGHCLDQFSDERLEGQLPPQWGIRPVHGRRPNVRSPHVSLSAGYSFRTYSSFGLQVPV
jgi:hypothetical protein